MKKFLLMLMVLMLTTSLFATLTPVLFFDGDRGHWLDYLDYGGPISVESGVDLWLYNTSPDDVAIHWLFIVTLGEVEFDLTETIVFPGFRLVYEESIPYQTIIIDGIGSDGSVFQHLIIEGDAIIDIYEGLPPVDYINDPRPMGYFQIGSFTVGNPVPEPASLFLLSCGAMVIFCSKKRIN